MVHGTSLLWNKVKITFWCGPINFSLLISDFRPEPCHQQLVIVWFGLIFQDCSGRSVIHDRDERVGGAVRRHRHEPLQSRVQEGGRHRFRLNDPPELKYSRII